VPSPDKYKVAEQAYNMSTKLSPNKGNKIPESRKESKHRPNWESAENRSKVQPVVGQYGMSSTYVRQSDGRVAYGALNGKKAAHFTSPYKAKYNDNPSPDKYRPVLSQTKPRPPSAITKSDKRHNIFKE
jgi:hypothetical protein